MLRLAQCTDHAGDAPDISTRVVAGLQQHLGRPVLPRLDVIRKVLVDPAAVTRQRWSGTNPLPGRVSINMSPATYIYIYVFFH